MSQNLKAPNASASPAVMKNGAVPDSNTLLAYKLLKDSWGEGQVFDTLMKNEMKYLVAGISLLESDPYLAMKMGGVTLNAAGQLANVIKQKEQELDINTRIEPIAKTILLHKFAKPNMVEMLPGRRVPATLTRNAQGAVALGFKASEPANTGIAMGAQVAARGVDAIIPNQGGNWANPMGGIIGL